MRLWIGLTIAVASLWLTFSGTGSGAGETPTLLPGVKAPDLAANAGELMGFVNPGAGGGQQVTIVNATRGTMLVYHVDSQTGQITLQSSRRLTWDFSLDQYNATKPLPNEIRRMLEQ